LIVPLVLAYNLGNFLRRLALPMSVKHWSLTTLREKLIRIGAKVVAHLRYVFFRTTEAAVPRALFTTIGNRFRLKRAARLGTIGAGDPAHRGSRASGRMEVNHEND